MTLELALVPTSHTTASLLERLDETKRFLAETSEIADIKDLHSRAQVAEIAARVQKSREGYQFAAEIRLWTERRAGALRTNLPRVHGIGPRFDWQEARRLREEGFSQREVGARLGVDKSAIGYAEHLNWDGGIPGVPVKEFDEQFGAHSAAAKRWEHMAEIPDARFEELISELKQADSSLTAAALLRRNGFAYQTRVEPGIFKHQDDRYSVKTFGEPMRIVGTLEEARAALAERRSERPVGVRRGRTVIDACQLISRACAIVGQLDGMSMPPAAKWPLAEASDALAKAEREMGRVRDAISRARRS